MYIINKNIFKDYNKALAYGWFLRKLGISNFKIEEIKL